MFKEAESWHLDIDRYLNRVIPASPLHKLPPPVSRFLGYRREHKQDVGNIMGAFWSLMGAFCGLAVVAAVFNNTESIQRHAPPAFIASFVSRQINIGSPNLTFWFRVHQQSSSTTQFAHLLANHAMLCLDTHFRQLSAWVYRRSSSITQIMRRSSG